MFLFLIILALIILSIAGLWKVFEKADKPGVAAIIPIYVDVIYYNVSGLSGWFALLTLGVSIYTDSSMSLFSIIVGIMFIFFRIYVNFRISERFSVSNCFLFSLGLSFVPFIFIPILGFGDARYNFEYDIEYVSSNNNYDI